MVFAGLNQAFSFIYRESASPRAALFLLPNRQRFIRTAVLLPVDVWIKPILMRRKILVVEDDPDQLEAIRGNLKDAGFAIGTAANGVDALIKTRSVSPDLIVLDLMLPQWWRSSNILTRPDWPLLNGCCLNARGPQPS